METRQLINALTTTGGEPGHPVSPVDKLRLLTALETLTATLTTELATEITSPTQAALFAHTTERAHQRSEITQIRAARTAQRTLVQELGPEALNDVRTIAANPAPFIAGTRELPTDPTGVPTGIMPFKDTTAFLQHGLKIPHTTALNRLHAANALLPDTDIHGNPTAARYPKLAATLETGTARLEPTAAAARKLDKLANTIARTPEPARLAARIEEKVAQSLATGIPKDTNRLLAGIGDELDNSPETEHPPTPAEIRDRTGITITKRSTYFSHISGCLLNADAEVFLALFAAADNPRTRAGNRQALAASATGMTPTTGNGTGNRGTAGESTENGAGNPDTTTNDTGQAPGPDPGTDPGTTNHTTNGTTEDPRPVHPDGPDWFIHPEHAETFPEPDPGSPPDPGADGLAAPQRHLQALLNLLRAPHLDPPKRTAGMPPAQLIILCHLDTLLGLAKGNGWSAHGLEIPIGEIRRRLATDGAIPVVLGGQSEVLDMGREMRLATDTIRRAVLARDGGCFYPGCTVPPEHLEMCHIDAWAAGGGTSVAGLTPGCTGHHHQADNGLLKLLIHNGLPHVLLPRHLDPEQIPRRNTYWPQNQTTLFEHGAAP